MHAFYVLQAQEKRDRQSAETQTLPDKKCATVNTGMSLIDAKRHPNPQVNVAPIFPFTRRELQHSNKNKFMSIYRTSNSCIMLCIMI